jgi:hypothetical protein
MTALLQVHYNISFDVMSQRLINNNILVEQGCASIKKQTFLCPRHDRGHIVLPFVIP